MKRFLSMLALAVLVLQSVVTSAVYAVNEEGEGTVPEAAVETVASDSVSDEGNDNDVVTDLTNSEVTTTEVEEITTVVEPKEIITETSVVEEPTAIEDETSIAEEVKTELEEPLIEDFYMPDFSYKKFMAPIQRIMLNVDNPKGACDENSTTTCIKNPVNTTGSSDNEGDVQITKVVEKTEVDGEYKITVEVKGNPVETVEVSPNNICSIVVFDRSRSMRDGDKEDVCVETYSEGDCMEHFLRWCTREAEGGECKRYESQSKKWNDAVNGAKVFASALNELNKDGDVAKIGLVTFAKDVHIGRTPAFSDLSDGIFGMANGGTNLDAGLLRAQELLDADEFCNTGNAKKYIVAITDGAPTFAGVSEIIGDGSNSSILTVAPQTKADAEAIKKSGIEIFTIGYQLEEIYGFNTADFLKNNIASSPNYAYEGENADKVAEAFQKISETIKEKPAGTEANLEDRIGGNVTLVTSDENQEPNEIKDFTITDDGQKIEFYVKIKDGAENGDYDTNAGVYLTYTGYNPETGEPIPGQELSINTSSQIHWVQPLCEGTQPTVEGVKTGAETYPRKWNAEGTALEPVGYSGWTYVDDKTDLEACEWTCDTTKGYEYDKDHNTCKKQTHIVTVDPNCAEGENCTVITGDVNHGSKYTLPTLERKYKLTYEENSKVENKVTPNPIIVEAELLGYCKGTKECTDADMKRAGVEVEVMDAVTYYAIWNEAPLTVNLVDGNGYTTPEYVYNFKEWQNEGKTVSESIKLIKDETLVAQYTSEAQNYTLTYKVDGDVYGKVETIAYGTKLEAREKPSKEGYTFEGWTPEVPETMPAKDVVVEGRFVASTDTAYTVEYYMQNVDGTDYVLDETRTETKAGTTNTEVSVTPGEVAGFTLNNEESTLTGVITADGKLVLKVYYDRVESTIIIDPNCEDENEVCNITTETGSYEKEITLPEKIRSYTLSYKVGEGALGVDSQTVTATVIGYCKGVSADCEASERFSVGETVKIEAESVTYTAVWSNDMIVTVATGSDYQTDSTVYTFNKWKDGETTIDAQSELTLVSDKELTATYSEACKTGYHYENTTNGETEAKICVNDEKKEGVECVKEGAPANAHYNVTTGAGTWSGTTQSYIGVKCNWDCNQGYIKDGNICRSSGGGGGGSSSSSYYCKNLPLHAIENNKDKPTKDTDYTYSQNTGAVCTFQCISGYTRNADKKQCVKSGGGNGGGDEVIELGGQVSDKCSVEGFEGSEEEKAAYLYACENDITTIRDINEARLKDFLTRAEMAKMVSVFATKELGMKPNTSKDCSNFANSIASYNQEMKDYMVMSCQLELMGIHTVDYKAIPDFMPSKRVSRAEFGTVLSRVLWGNKYEGTNSNYYINHLNALKENNIITNINPNITEYRAWVFLMLYRAVEAIKVLKSTNGVAIDQQVNEELQEEGKAETGLVVEYDSGSVVPEMAIETASGTLTTGDIAKDEAKVETGSIETETGSTND